MLSKNKIKLIQSLDSKKIRLETGLFIIEGDKMVAEIMNSAFSIDSLLATSAWFEKHNTSNLAKCKDVAVVTQEELIRCSFLKSPQQALCLVRIPQYTLEPDSFRNNLSLLLDTVQDPGNLGTIIRIADWFGIGQIVCTPQTADAYNPKVVQSTMGAIARVKIFYQPMQEVLPLLKSQNIPIYGTALDGENIYTTSLKPEGCIMMGNESKGINPLFTPYLSHKLFIPFFPPGHQHSESLNVSIATGIICAEFRRQQQFS